MAKLVNLLIIVKYMQRGRKSAYKKSNLQSICTAHKHNYKQKVKKKNGRLKTKTNIKQYLSEKIKSLLAIGSTLVLMQSKKEVLQLLT